MAPTRRKVLARYKTALHNALVYQNELTRRLVRKDAEIKRLKVEVQRLSNLYLLKDDVISQAEQVVNQHWQD